MIFVGDRQAHPPEPYVQIAEKEAFSSLIKGQSRAARLLLTLHYRDGFNISEAGRVIGVGRARAHSIHKHAL